MLTKLKIMGRIVGTFKRQPSGNKQFQYKVNKSNK